MGVRTVGIHASNHEKIAGSLGAQVPGGNCTVLTNGRLGRWWYRTEAFIVAKAIDQGKIVNHSAGS